MKGSNGRRGLIAAAAALLGAGAVQLGNVKRVMAAPTQMFTETNNTATTTTYLTSSGGGGNGAFNVTNSNGQGLVAVSTGGGGFAVNAFSSTSAAMNANSNANHGIQGGTSAASVYGLYGSTTGNGGGVFGTGGASGFGIVGQAGGSNPGVFGSSGTGPGVFGQGTSGIGVSGRSTNQIGVYGFSANSTAVYGESTGASQYGVYGKGTNIGVGGEGAIGVLAFSAAGSAVYATSTTGSAGTFNGRVNISSNLDVAGNLSVQGMKSAVVRDKSNNLRRLYCVESPDSVFEDYGEARLAGGSVRVKLEDGFAGVVHTDRYLVFLTPTSETPGLFVANRDQSSFEVRETGGGTGAASFCWRIVAKRADVEAPRLQAVEARGVNDNAPDDVRQRGRNGSVIIVNEGGHADRPTAPVAPELPRPPATPPPAPESENRLGPPSGRPR